MEGYSEPALQGIIPRSFAHIFDAIRANCNPQKQFLVRASYLEIYQEVRRAGLSCSTRSPAAPPPLTRRRCDPHRTSATC